MNAVARCRVVCTLALSLSAFSGARCFSPALAVAEQPRVGFDVAYLIPCREITPPDFACQNPGEMLVEAVFDISSLIQSGSEADLVQVFYQLHGCDALTVVDHLPRTEFSSNIAGPIQIERKGENSAKLGGDAAGDYPNVAKANLNISAGSSSATTMRYELLPPQELVAASGTVNRGRGVFFKLKPSARESLEGARQFVCVFRAPRTWRGDLVRVECSAASAASAFSDQAADCGRQEFEVGLYLQGDEPARCAMTQYLLARERLLSAVGKNRERLEARLFANQVPGWGTVRAWLGSQSGEEIVRALTQRCREGSLHDLDVPEVFSQLVCDYCAAEIGVQDVARGGKLEAALK